jgi:hypothetical protein
MRRVHVSAERLERWLAGFDERHAPVRRTITPTTVTLEGADGDRAELTVPFPPLEGDLVEHVLRERTVAVLLVRRRGHAVGIFEGTRLVASKVDSSYVQGTTKAGGWSQQRYARRRDNQTQASFGSAADTATRVLLPRVGDLDALICGGDKPAVTVVLADPRLAPLQALRVEPFLAVPDPKLRVLEASVEQFRGVAVTLEP